MSIRSNNRAFFVDSDVEPHFSKKRYMPYHSKIQNKINRFHQDYFFVVMSDASIDTGINMKKYSIDAYNHFDIMKGGNV